MQKFTVFMILLAVVVTVVVADLLSKSYLDDARDDLITAEIQETTDPFDLPQASHDLEEALPEGDAEGSSGEGLTDETLITEEGPSEVADFLRAREFTLGTLTSADLFGIGFKDMDIEEAANDGLLYQLLDISVYPNLNHKRFHMTDGDNIFGVLHEFQFETETEAQAFYDSLRQKVGAFSPGVTSNETNQFGLRSYFMNDSKRIGTAFLTFQLSSRVYGFSYPKASHEFFKSLIILLEERLREN